ncbi:MAG TPA: triose-phosphate isomerase [Burkholderiales bacterium]|jgi:triosephosphate isomerase|nr:triose-phosphate isomerase [Burkholderiales bacterium]
MRQRLAVGNWKMHGSLPENQALLDAVVMAVAGLRQAICAVCVPFPYLAQTQAALAGSKVAWGAQNVSQHPRGAFTGEVSAGMLREFGCRFVIVGHSERRQWFSEDDRTIALKAKAVLAAGMVPIVCVGETLAERESGVTEDVVGRQITAVLDELGGEGLKGAVLAYEPVWAIGTGRTATPEQVQAVHTYIRGLLAKRDGSLGDAAPILYGGSVKAANAAELFAMPDVDGGLIGGASLAAQEFIAICKAADAPIGRDR